MAYSKEYYQKNKEKFLETQRKYLAKKRAEKDSDWLAKKAEYMKEYYSTHEKQRLAKKEYDKKYYQEHKEYFKNYAKINKDREVEKS